MYLYFIQSCSDAQGAISVPVCGRIGIFQFAAHRISHDQFLAVAVSDAAMRQDGSPAAGSPSAISMASPNEKNR